MIRAGEGGQQSEPQMPQPGEQEAEVVAGGGEDGVDGVAGGMGEMVAAHAVLGLEMADDGLDGGAAPGLALDLRRHAPLLARGVDPELVIGRGVPPAAHGRDRAAWRRWGTSPPSAARWHRR